MLRHVGEHHGHVGARNRLVFQAILFELDDLCAPERHLRRLHQSIAQMRQSETIYTILRKLTDAKRTIPG